MLPFKSFFKLTTLLVLCLFAAQTLAQTTTSGDIAGTVTDPSGAVVAGATVTITSTDYGTTDTVKTSSTGAYRLPSLKPGNYKVTVSQTGFRTTVKAAVVAIGQVTTANIQLQIGQTSETVEVTGAAPLIQSENANISTSFSPQQVDLLPNGGNDLTAVAQTAPGVVMNNGAGYGNFSAFGLPATANLFTVNGNDEMDPYLNLNNSGATNLLLGKNEVQEVAVVSNGYTGQYGRQAGAQVDYATKSGTNDWHGNLLYWYNTAGFNANDWFNDYTSTPKPEAIANQWGASIGGPIKKDKLFFFLDNEGTRFVLATNTLALIPTQAFASAVVNNLVADNAILGAALGAPAINPAVSVPFYNHLFGLYRNALGASRAVPVTNLIDTTGNLGCGDINVFSGPSSIGQPAAGAGNLYPALAAFGGTSGYNPGEGGWNTGGGLPCADYYRSTAGTGANEWVLATRVDYNLSNNDKLYFRFRSDRGVQPTYTDAINPVFNATSSQPADEGQVNWTHTFSPSILNQFVGSVAYYSAFFIQPQQSAASALLPFVFIDADLSSWSYLGGEGYAFPQGRAVTQYQFIDDLSITKGAHALKMGLNFRRNDITDATFSTVVTNPEMESFSETILDGGMASRGSQRFAPNPKVPDALYSFGLYFQDEYRITSNLKLTLALRADRNSNMICGVDCFSYLTNPFQDTTHNNTLGWTSISSIDQHSLLRNMEKVVLEPRFGFTWSPMGHQNTVLRGGVGLFSDLYPGTFGESFERNAPFSQRFTLTAAPFAPGGFTPLAPGEPGNMLSTMSACNATFLSHFSSGNPDSFAADPARPLTCTPPIQTDQPAQFVNPKYLQWNFEVQQAIGSKMAFTLNYVGNYGYDEIIENPWLNAWSTATFGPGGPGTGTATFGNLPFGNTTDTTACSGCSFLQAPDGHFSNVLQFSNAATSNYHGLTATLTRRLSKGFTGSLNYTWSHAIDEISNGGFLPFNEQNGAAGESQLVQLNPYCLRCQNYSSADYDVRHNVTANYTWDLPFRASGNALNKLVSGWSVSGTYFYHTGYPYGVIDGLGSSTPGLHNVSSGTFEATFLGGPTSPGCSTVVTPCLTGSQFLSPASGSGFGNIPRNFFRGPGYFDSDFTVLKNIPITERFKLGLGTDIFNIFNHPNFANPVSDVSNGAFGTIQTTVTQPTNPYGSFVGSAVSGRVLELHARLTF